MRLPKTGNSAKNVAIFKLRVFFFPLLLLLCNTASTIYPTTHVWCISSLLLFFPRVTKYNNNNKKKDPLDKLYHEHTKTLFDSENTRLIYYLISRVSHSVPNKYFLHQIFSAMARRVNVFFLLLICFKYSSTYYYNRIRNAVRYRYTFSKQQSYTRRPIISSSFLTIFILYTPLVFFFWHKNK